MPGDRDKVLLPLAFCRECGQEYYTVGRRKRPPAERASYEPRELSDATGDDEDATRLPLHRAPTTRGPTTRTASSSRVPDDWLEDDGDGRARSSELPQVPAAVDRPRRRRRARVAEAGCACHCVPAPFRFCLDCGVAYGGRQTRDFGKLDDARLRRPQHARRRSSASPTVRSLRRDEHARAGGAQAAQLHRQPPGRLAPGGPLQRLRRGRAAALGALPGRRGGRRRRASRHDELAATVFDALDLAARAATRVDPAVQFAAARRTPTRALRDVLGYRLYRDLERGWRVTAPEPRAVRPARDRLRVARRALRGRGRVGRAATRRSRRRTPASAAQVAHGAARLPAPRARDPGRLPRRAAGRSGMQAALEPAPGRPVGDRRGRDARARRDRCYPRAPARSARLPRQRLPLGPRRLRPVPAPPGDVPGTTRQAHRSTTREHDHPRAARGAAGRRARRAWSTSRRTTTTCPATSSRRRRCAGTPATARSAFHDPIRVPHAPEDGGRTNPFFVDFYRERRRRRRRASRRASTPRRCRYERARGARGARSARRACRSSTARRRWSSASTSPSSTSSNMRNVPPTPANYAQRIGRAGRSGQPALVFTYCSAGSSHDQYFFRRPELMVAGQVRAAAARPRERGPRARPRPRDLARRDRRQTSAARSRDVLDVDGDDADARAAATSVASSIEPRRAARARKRARPSGCSRRIRGARRGRLVHDRLARRRARRRRRSRFDRACDRWRDLYRAALEMRATQNKVIGDASRSADERDRAQRLRARGRERSSSCSAARRRAARCSPTSTATATSPARASCPATASRGCRSRPSSPARRGPRRQRRVPLAAALPRDQRVRPAQRSSTTRARRYLINQVILPGRARTEDNQLVLDAAQAAARAAATSTRSRATAPGSTSASAAAQPLDAAADAAVPARRTSPRSAATGSTPTRRSAAPGLRDPHRRPLRRARRRAARPPRRGDGRRGGDDRSPTSTYGQRRDALADQPRLAPARRTSDQLGFVLDTERGYWAKNDAGPPTTRTTR